MSEMSAPRVEQFREEIERLRIRGGSTTSERRLLVASAVVAVAGVVVMLVAFNGSQGASDARDQTDFVILALLGLALAIAGTIGWARLSLTRYFRYWLVRLIYEEREQTDRLIAALREGNRET
jgi:hypothetical protein